MYITTVNDLLDHFGIYPDAINYFDEVTNTEDTVYLASSELGGIREYDGDKFDEFIKEFGDCILTSWKYTGKDTLVLTIRTNEEVII